MNVTRGDSLSVTKENATFTTVAEQSTEKATFNGPTITIVNSFNGSDNSDYRKSLSHIYISPTTDGSWGSNRLEPGRVLEASGKTVDLQLPYPLSSVSWYDIMGIQANGQIRILRNVEVTDGSKIVFKEGEDISSLSWKVAQKR